jgi:hypothetical protein
LGGCESNGGESSSVLRGGEKGLDLGRSWSYVGCVHTVERGSRVLQLFARLSRNLLYLASTTKNRSATRSEQTFSKQLHKHLPKQAPGYICLKNTEDFPWEPRTPLQPIYSKLSDQPINPPTVWQALERRRELAEVGMSTFWLRTPKNGGENLEHFHYPSVVNPQGKCIIRFAGTCGQTP